MELYNLAIRFAEPGGKELGLAFANRSALLLEEHEPANALRDIRQALKNNYPKELVHKLLRRRVKCFQMLQVAELMQEVGESKVGAEKLRKFRDEELLTLKNPNPLIPSAESFVEIGYAVDLGRQLVVTQDIPAGKLRLLILLSLFFGVC